MYNAFGLACGRDPCGGYFGFFLLPKGDEMTAQCHYCVKGAARDAVCLDICKLSVSTFYLFREQSHHGRCIVSYDEHVGDITDISDEQRNAFFADVARASRAIKSVFNPDKVNYSACQIEAI